jgi:Flp pilus assembly protein TadG
VGLRDWLCDQRGAAAIEFVFVVPIIGALYFGGYELTRLNMAYRKLCDATAQLGIIVSQGASPTSPTVLQTYIGAAAQVMYPQPTSTMTVKLTEIVVDGNGAATIGWSQGWSNGAATSEPYAAGASVSPTSSPALPASMLNSNMTTVNTCAATTAPCYSYLLVQSSYVYMPVIGAKYIGGPITLTNQVYMPPRNTATITCNGC